MRGALPAERLIEALGLETRRTAEVQDLYSRPIAASAIALKRHPEPVRLPSLAAA